MNRISSRLASLCCLAALTVSIVGIVGCGSGEKRAAAAAALAQRRQESKIQTQRTQEKNALKDYNSGS